MTNMMKILEAAELLEIEKIEVLDWSGNEVYYRGNIMETPAYIFSNKNVITSWSMGCTHLVVQIEFCEHSRKAHDSIYS